MASTAAKALRVAGPSPSACSNSAIMPSPIYLSTMPAAGLHRPAGLGEEGVENIDDVEGELGLAERGEAPDVEEQHRRHPHDARRLQPVAQRRRRPSPGSAAA